MIYRFNQSTPASFPYPINYSLQTTLNPSSKKLLAYRRWHGALSTLPGAIRDKDGEKEKYEREKKIEKKKKAEQRFWKRVGAMLYWRPDVCGRVRDSGQRQHQHIDSGGGSGGRGREGEAKATQDDITFK